jgi:hypothetical protein
MAQPRKYKTAADRFRAYRERKKEREEALSHDLKVTLAGGGKRKRGAPHGYDAVVLPGQDPELRKGLFALREEITRVRLEARAERYDHRWNPNIAHTKKLIALNKHVQSELPRLAGNVTLR